MKESLLIILLFFNGQVLAQKENNVWIFGHGAGLDFNTGVAVPITKQFPSNEGCAAVCSPSGVLLFYTNGVTVWNRNGQDMPNGNNLVSYPTARSSQGALIVPVVNSATKYYIFSLEEAESSNPSSCRLSYSIVDMALDNGLGDVDASNKGVLVTQGLTEKMIAIPGGDCNIWVLTHEKGTNQFMAFSVDEAGVNTTPVVSAAGALSGTHAYLSGVMKISPDRRKLVVCSAGNMTSAIPGATGAELADFDPATGIVSNAQVLTNQEVCYGGSFSPDGSKLYIGGDRHPVNGQFLAQYDLTQPNISAIVGSKTDLFQNLSSGFIKVTDLRIGPDGKLYMNSATNLSYMDVVNNPNTAGVGAGYASNALQLNAATTVDYGLPNIFCKPVPSDTIYRSHEFVLCDPPDSLVLIAPSDYFFFQWGDGLSGSTRTIKTLGTYTVISRTYCKVRIDTFRIAERVNVSFSLGGDTMVCAPGLELSVPEIGGASYLWSDGNSQGNLVVNSSGQYALTITKKGCTYSDTIDISVVNFDQSIEDYELCKGEPIDVVLQANVPGGATATWSNGSSSSTIQVKDEGVYWVTVSNGVCTGTDTTTIKSVYCDCRFGFPTAFSPNEDGRNDRFKIISQSECPVRGYLLTIYNRWGEKVYISNNPWDGWDGKYRGVPAPVGTYMYTAEFAAGERYTKHYEKGDVTLIR